MLSHQNEPALNWPWSGSRTFRTWFGPELNLRFGVHVRPMSKPEPLPEPNVQVLRGFTTPVVDFISRIQKELKTYQKHTGTRDATRLEPPVLCHVGFRGLLWACIGLH